ncbi:unnamed protein product [Oncorhynchus mykiss]|uniref:Uncharacterized protein n=1 Tax=Oncorhynchus mykiss TaxID=8022 RepID=A0A060ZGK9_ONCMY|nr:unnamed protein product [Oncorhynchus mykiss]
MTAADELSSSVSTDTGFGSSAPALPPDPPELFDLTDSQDPHDNLDPAPPRLPAIDTPPGSLCEDGDSPTTLPLLPPIPDSPCGSVCEEDVTLALKELDERCEEEEADFSDMSR